MDIKEGDRIKVFEDTDVNALLRYIRVTHQHRAEKKGEYVVIGKPYKAYHTTNYGKQIKDARRAKKMTREQLAEKCGVKVKTVWDWEIGRSKPKEWQIVQKVLEI